MAATSQTSKRVGWFEFQATLPRWAKMTLAASAWAIFLGVWQFAPRSPELAALLPTPLTVLETLYNLFAEKDFAADVWQSLQRTMLSFALAVAVAMPIGLLMGAFPAVEAFLNPIVSPFAICPRHPSFRCSLRGSARATSKRSPSSSSASSGSSSAC